MAVRLTQKLTDVANEVEIHLKTHCNVTDAMLANWRKVANQKRNFPVANMAPIADMYIDYEVQRDVLYEHIINIMKRWDARICSPISASRLKDDTRINTYDGQHRSVASAILGFTEIPCAIVETNDPNFPSYAFEMLNDTGVRRLTPGDLHRNALVRYKNGSRDIKNVIARTMQDQFDSTGIDLQDKKSRASKKLRGDHDYFFSHFIYAQKAMDTDNNGKVLHSILHTIKTVFPSEEEIDRGVFIGLLELHRLNGTRAQTKLPQNWMEELLLTAKKTFASAELVHSKARNQWKYIRPGASWSAPSAMSNFLRELYIRNGGIELNLPYHGEGAKMGIIDGNIAPGLFPARV